MSENPPAGTQAVGRALGVLKALAASSGELNGSAIAAELGLSSGTTHRIIGALLADDLVARSPKSDRYHLSGGAVLLGQAAQRSFGIDKMLPVLEGLNMETSESVNLSVRSGAESVVMVRVQSTLPLRFEQRPGARFPLYATASGKAILAMSPHVEMYLKTLPRQLSKVTQYTLETPDELARELQETRERGYSIDEQENVEGVRCVGAPVLDRDGSAQAALVIQVPSVRLPKSRVRSLGGRLVQAAAEAARFIPVNRAMSR